MEENIKRKLQLKYIFNTIRFKIYCGGYMKGFYSHTKKNNNNNNNNKKKNKKEQKKQTNTTKNNF